MIIASVYDIAQRYVGIKELTGAKDHPLIQWWLSLCSMGTDAPDETPWCSAFVNGMAWEMRYPRSKSAAARSNLLVGVPTRLEDAKPENDVVIIKRGTGSQPGPDVIKAQGHVGFFAGLEGTDVLILGGNQGDGVSIARFPVSSILGIRRLA